MANKYLLPKAINQRTRQTVKEQDELEVSDLPAFVIEEKDKVAKPHPMDPPAVLVMRRKAIRLYPHNQRVALYHIDKLNKYVTIPYTTEQEIAVVEEDLSALDKLNIIIESKELAEQTKEDIFSVYYKLNNDNREKFVVWAQENFNDMLSFVKSNTK